MAKFLDIVTVHDIQAFLDIVREKRLVIDRVTLRIEPEPSRDRSSVSAQAKLFSGIVHSVSVPADDPQTLIDTLYRHCIRLDLPTIRLNKPD